MKSVKSKRLRAIGLFIILIALILSYYKNIYKAAPGPVVSQSKETDTYFDDSKNLEKVRIDIKVKSISELKKLITSTIENSGAQKVISNEQNSYGNYIYLIESSRLQPIKTALNGIAIGTPFVDEKVSPNTTIDLEGKLATRIIDYDRLRNKANLTSYDRNDLKSMEHEIDSLKLEIANLRNKALTLLYIKAGVILSTNGRYGSFTNFLLGFVFYVILFTAIVALIYYGTYVLMFLLGMMGVKLPSITGYLGKGYNAYAGYKGYRGYGSYGYGGSSRKRRIKRIYRDKHSPDSEQHESDK